MTNIFPLAIVFFRCKLYFYEVILKYSQVKREPNTFQSTLGWPEENFVLREKLEKIKENHTLHALIHII